MSEARESIEALPFDVAAWWDDTGVQVSSLEARGLWAEMLWIAWVAEPRGALKANGIPLDSKSLAKMVRADSAKVEACLAELEKNNVFSRFPDGTIYSRRMYEDDSKRRHLHRVRSQAGKMGTEKRWSSKGNKKDSKTPKSISQEEVFRGWNEEKVIVHRVLTDQMKRAINSQLKHYTAFEIIQAIKNYAYILREPGYIWSYKWTLKDFLNRGLDKFLDIEIAKGNYKKWGSKYGNRQKEKSDEIADDLKKLMP